MIRFDNIHQHERRLQKEISWLLREKYDGKSDEGFKKDVERLKYGEPIDYVIGFSDFLGCRINLSKKPFIPRPETEYWTKHAIEDIQKSGKEAVKCLDLFAGSGCVGIAILSHIPGARVDFAERNKKFCGQIKKNLVVNKIDPSRYRIIPSNIFSRISGTYHYIFANLPYVPEQRKQRVQKSVLSWEPKEAVFGGDDGLFYIRKTLYAAPQHLKKGGKLFMEFDSPQKKDIGLLLTDTGFSRFSFFRDQYGRWRYIIVVK